MCAECAVVVMDYVIISGHCTPAAAATMIFNFVLSLAWWQWVGLVPRVVV